MQVMLGFLLFAGAIHVIRAPGAAALAGGRAGAGGHAPQHGLVAGAMYRLLPCLGCPRRLSIACCLGP